MTPSSHRWIPLAVVVALVAAAFWLLVARPVGPSAGSTTRPSTLSPATSPSPSAPTGPASAAAGARGSVCREGDPTTLEIPALGVDAGFEPIGVDTKAPVDAEGRHPLGNPTDRTKAGWYADGPRPGSGRGTILTNGHTYRNGSAIFKEDFARRIAVGQLIRIITSDGSTCSYRVERVWREVNAARDYPRIIVSEHLYNFDGPERLFLTTCGGSWNAMTQNYDDISLLIATPIDRG